MTDDALAPLADVAIMVDAEPIGSTDATGSFTAATLAPGAHYVAATKEGYVAVGQDVPVQAGEVTSLKLILVPAAAVDAFYETQIKTGVLGCGGAFRLGTPSSSSTTLCGNTFLVGVYVDTYLLGWNVGELVGSDVVGFWGETTWTSSQALGSGMQVIWFVSSASPEAAYFSNRISSVAAQEGTSPVQIPLPIEPILNATDQQPTGTQEIVCQTGACWLESGHYSAARTLGGSAAADVGFTAQQRFDDFLTTFHKGVLPAEFTALPDG